MLFPISSIWEKKKTQDFLFYVAGKINWISQMRDGISDGTCLKTCLALKPITPSLQLLFPFNIREWDTLDLNIHFSLSYEFYNLQDLVQTVI